MLIAFIQKRTQNAAVHMQKLSLHFLNIQSTVTNYSYVWTEIFF